jgi:hypothetical protein
MRGRTDRQKKCKCGSLVAFAINLKVYQLLLATFERGDEPPRLEALPAQVSLGFDGLRYFGASVLRLLSPFVRTFDNAPFVGVAKESSRSREAVKRLRSWATRDAIATSTFAFTASNSSKLIELNCFTITPSVNKGAFV